MKTIPVLSFLSALALLAGCAVGPEYERPESALPDFPDSGDAPPAPEAWWSRFGDPTLDHLLAATIAGNHDLEAGRQNIVKARALLDTVQGGNRPQLSAGGSVIRQERSENALFPVLEGTPGFPDRTETLFSAGFDATWEIDLFGRNRNTEEAGEFRVAWTEFSLQNLQASILAETGRLYISWINLDRNIAFLRETIGVQEHMASVLNARYKAGSVSELEPARATARLHQLQATLPSLQAEREAVLSALSTLTSIPRNELRQMLEGAERIPEVEPFMGDTIESGVLQQRPDLRMAETRIQQANKELGAHVANLYPRFVLVGSLGLESVDTSTFAESASRFWRLGPSITLPILEGGRLRGRVDAAEADLQIRISQYRQQVLKALGESETALIRFNRGIEETQLTEEAFASTTTALETARRQYEAGVLPLDAVLNLQEEQLSAHQQLVRARSRTAIALISLGKALGGSWDFNNEGTSTHPQ